MPNLTGQVSGVQYDFKQRNFRAYGWNGRNRMPKYDGENWRNVGIPQVKANIVRTADAAGTITITTASAHGFSVGYVLDISVVNNASTYNGRVTVASVPTSTTFTYAQGAATVSAADNGGTAVWAPTVAAGNAVVKGITGVYYYYVVPINSLHRVYGNRVVAGMPSAISNAVVCNNQSVTISNIPSTHADAQVDKWAIYRNKNAILDSNTQDDENEFWKVAEVAIGTTSYVDEAQDDSLPPESLDFNANLPPTFKAAEVFGERLFGTGFDAYTTGTATVNTVTTLIDFSGASIPNGFLGCFFKKDGDDVHYVITEIVSASQVCLDRPFSGTLSASAYQIYRDESELYYSEWGDFDCWGPDTEAYRNKLYIGTTGSGNRAMAVKALNDSLWVFTKDKIYRVYGKDYDRRAIKITPEPFYDGIGCVGPKALVSVDNMVYFLSLRGPMMFDGSGAPIPFGERLGQNWLNELNVSQLGISCAGYSPTKDTIKFAVPGTSLTENSIIYVYHRSTKTWWREQYKHPSSYFNDYDSNGNPALFYTQGKFVFQDDTGTSDGVPSGTITGTVTSTTTTSVTVSSASFYTTGSGLAERYVHIFRGASDTSGPHAYIGSRRITSNTGTVINWSSSGAGGGTLTVPSNAVIFVGPVYWWWTTKSEYVPAGHQQINGEVSINLDLQGEGTVSDLYVTDIANDTTRSQIQKIAGGSVFKKTLNRSRCHEYAAKVEVRATNNAIAIRDIVVDKVGGIKNEK